MWKILANKNIQNKNMEKNNFFKKINGLIKEKGLLTAIKIFLRAGEYFLRKDVLKQGKIHLKINNLYLMELNLQNKALDRALFLFRSREEMETKVVKNFLKPGMNVLDLGANIGYYSLLMAKLVGDKGKIFAVEPFPENFVQLKINVGLNNLQSIVNLDNIAISDKTEEVDFFVGSEHNLGTLLKEGNEYQITGSIKVKAVSLVDYLKGKPEIDFLRMDIEGWEAKIFNHMQESWPSDRPYPKNIFFEVHPEGDIDPDPAFSNCFQGIIDLGYRVKLMVASSNPKAKEKFSELGYQPKEEMFSGHILYENIKPEHLILLGARRPKLVRAIFLEKI